jgi:hypothetical protein
LVCTIGGAIGGTLPNQLPPMVYGRGLLLGSGVRTMSKIKRHLEESMSWQDIANLTHATQVEKFNWCACEEQEQFPYEDCPRVGEGEK